MTRSSPRRAPRRAAAALLLALLPGAAPAAGAEGLAVEPAWAADPIWDDGLAEVALYDAERVVYGKPRRHQQTIIVVKEDLAADSGVKADPPYEGRDLVTVLKVNLISTVPTENYPYHFLASLFVRRDDVRRLVKATVGSQEWCGNTFKEVVARDGRPRLHFHSYFDGEADGEREIALAEGAFLDEQLVLILRAAKPPERGPALVRIADPIVTNRAGPVAVREAEVAAGPVAEVEAPAGSFRARRWEARRGGGLLATYWIEEAPRRALVKMEAADGRRLALVEISRRDYWSR
jgi:hypothetical protein